MAHNSEKRRWLTLKNKVKVIESHKKGRTISSIANEYQVSRGQIRNIIYRSEAIIQKLQDGGRSEGKIVKVKSCPNDQLNNRVFDWFCETRSKNITINGPLMQEKALMFAKEMGLTKFKASNGWLESFQKRNSIKFSALNGEDNDILLKTSEEWKESLCSLLFGYAAENIFTCDEFGLLYKMIPSNSLIKKSDDDWATEKCKNGITVMLAVSAMGEKLKPVIVGKSMSQRYLNEACFSGIHYKTNRKACMTSSIFSEWLHKINNKMNLEDRKIVLLVNNSPVHLNQDLSNIKLLFLPPNATSKLRPLYAGIIQEVKFHYKKTLLRHIIFQMDSSETLSDVATKVTLTNAIDWLKFSWNLVEIPTIKKCFERCGFLLDIVDNIKDDEYELLDDEFSKILPSDLPFHKFVSFDDNIDTCCYDTETDHEEIIDDDDDERDDKVDVVSHSNLSHKVVWQMSNQLICYANAKGNVELNKCLMNFQDQVWQEKLKDNWQ